MKHLNNNQEFRFNEILFEHRNKEYGAYALRNESDRILTKALFIGVSLLAAISITPLVISAFNNEPSTVHVPTDGPPVVIKLKKVDRIETPPAQIVKPVQPVATPNQKQYDSSVPTPTKDAVEPIKQDKPKDATAGLIDNFKGDPVKPDTYTPPAPVIGTGTIPSVKPQPVVPVKDPNEIVGLGGLSVEAAFEGGINTFRNKVISNFDGSGFEDQDVMKTTITFIVETNGTISGIKADGKDADFNNEAIRTIKSIRGKWVPGKNKQGESVRSYFKFPISMKFDN
ncbi:energy transducer TonB [Chryseobacterium sp. G0201]|uniref:energy transducer TonB n=1 Tax=Chryseobacterium sp. G0201 TaxID=2487065 RepID=UPI000F4D9B2D|nr:energy transducer TonB [Chryseobacterium sp. G0201]AZA53729.1 energy transducer TonB [Chryseobacterium sp. G0201]